MTKEQTDFIISIENGAWEGWLKYKILPSVTIAQAILESGWGKSGLTKNANNLFGIKAGNNWSGKRYTCNTKEYINGKYVGMVAQFRAYDSLNESMEDHGLFLAQLGRYRNVVGERDYKKACMELQKAGYATAPNYAETLIRLIETYNLKDYDTLTEPRPTEIKLYNCHSGPVTYGDMVVIKKLFTDLKLDFVIE